MDTEKTGGMDYITTNSYFSLSDLTSTDGFTVPSYIHPAHESVL
jgi:hypothetical protein